MKIETELKEFDWTKTEIWQLGSITLDSLLTEVSGRMVPQDGGVHRPHA